MLLTHFEYACLAISTTDEGIISSTGLVTSVLINNPIEMDICQKWGPCV